MAIEREIPKDINKYKAKFLGPLTVRQTVCFVPAAIIGIGFVMLTKDVLPQDVCFMIALCLAAPLILCGVVEVNGLPFDKFIQTAFVSMVLAPKHRVYKTVNLYEKALSTEEVPVSPKKQKEAKKQAEKYKSKNPQLKAYK